MNKNSTTLNIKQTSYVVTFDGMIYHYALHSKNYTRIIFPSQVLNILEYCLFKKVKDGWNGQLTRDALNFNIDFFIGKNRVENWSNKERFENDMFTMLKYYFSNLKG